MAGKLWLQPAPLKPLAGIARTGSSRVRTDKVRPAGSNGCVRTHSAQTDSARPHKFRPSRMDGGAYGSGTFTPVTALVWHRTARLCGDVCWDTALLRGQPATRNFGDRDYLRVARGASGHADCLPGDCAANGARGGRNYLCARAGDGNPALPSDKNSFGD